MKSRSVVALLLLAVVAAAVLAGCGGGGGSSSPGGGAGAGATSSGGGEASSGDFASAADAACKQANQEIAGLGTPQQAEVTKYLERTEVVIAGLQKRVQAAAGDGG